VTTVEGMPQMHDLADTFDDAMLAMKDSLADARRQLAAWSLVNYPSKDTLNEQAHELRRTLKAAAIEINAISKDHQTTVAGAPKVLEARIIPVKDSLCVITAGLGSPLAVDDMHTDAVLACHPAGGAEADWFSWASAPIVVNQCVAGTVCALEKDRARQWSLEDQEALEDMAARIGRLIDIWSGVS